MLPRRNGEWMRRLVALDLRRRSSPSASPVVPSPADASGTFASSASAEAQVLGVTECALDAPALGIQVDQSAGGLLGAAGSQAPRLLQLLGQHPVELVIGEAAVGHDAPRGPRLGAPGPDTRNRGPGPSAWTCRASATPAPPPVHGGTAATA